MRMNLKNKVFCCAVGLVLLFADSLLSQAQLPIIETPYGAMNFSDDDESYNILEWLSLSSGSQKIDSINSAIIINVSNVADGSLGELMGGICINDFINKPEAVISIYNSSGFKRIESYLNRIAWELCVESQGDSIDNLQGVIKDFSDRIRIKSVKSSDINSLNAVLAFILKRMEFYRQEL